MISTRNGRLGILLFTIGLFILSPLDEIFILLPLAAIVGAWVFPVAIAIGFICLILGALLTGKHIMPHLKKPVVIIMLIVAIIITIYVLSDWVII